MCLARQIDQFFRNTRQPFSIEVEAKRGAMLIFLARYNDRTHSDLNPDSGNENGVVLLAETDSKWAPQLRCYFNDNTGFPAGVKITQTRTYRAGEYRFRFNGNDLIETLLYEYGYRLGRNQLNPEQ